MKYRAYCMTPLGEMVMASDGETLCGLWFTDQKRLPAAALARCEERELAVFGRTRRWLAQYFDGREPDFTPPLAPEGTAFQLAVRRQLCAIPRGETRSYGELARALGSSARAVGNAVGRNPIALIVPCHRVIGAQGALTGYAGGLARKRALLALEARRAP